MGVSVVIEGLYDGIEEIFDSLLLEKKTSKEAEYRALLLCLSIVDDYSLSSFGEYHNITLGK